MITAAIVALAMQGANTRDFAFGGVPYLAEAAPGLVRVPTHDVQVQVAKGDAQVSTTTALKNTSNEPLSLTLVVPRRSLDQPGATFPAFDVQATWNGSPIKLSPYAKGRHSAPAENGLLSYANDLAASVNLPAQATVSLKVRYTTSLGRTGYSLRQRLAGYLLGGRQTIEQLNVTYRYEGDTVFRLPDASPKLGWQIGSKGAFVRLNDFEPKSTLTYLQFYPGGFEDIGD